MTNNTAMRWRNKSSAVINVTFQLLVIYIFLYYFHFALNKKIINFFFHQFFLLIRWWWRERRIRGSGVWRYTIKGWWRQSCATSGTCPYGDHCQFAQGITELRPVIRPPRYKTELCRMVLAGDTCPYGHRCHFRHTLTDQERPFLLAPPPRW